MTVDVEMRSSLLEQTFRSNPVYEFVPFRRFNGAEQDLIDGLARDAGVCGMLRPRAPTTLGVKAATRSLAALFRTRQTPGPLPLRLRRAAADPAVVDDVARLVLDGILEVEHGGEFVGGIGAAHLLDDGEPSDETADPLEALSLAAIRYGEAIEIDSSASLSARMYFYNRIPVTPRWAHRLPTRDAVLEFLRLGEGSDLRRVADRCWRFSPPDDTQGWLIWNPRESSPRRSKDAPMHKIYVSAMPSHLPDVMMSVVRVLSKFDSTAFKVGADVHGLLRPDKLVIYLSDRRQLPDVATELTHALDGMSPHGVPFTASAGGDTALISRGIDPPRTSKLLTWRENESWRLWVTNRLAVYLLTARTTRTPATTMTDARFARARLRLDGVDTRQWIPDAIEWAKPTATVS